MKIRTTLICLCAAALLAGPNIVLPLRAQSSDHPEPRVQNRYLLIFDTSSAMKRRLPTEIKAINALFEITLNGKMRAGDSIGVWTFNRDLHMGQFPQQGWSDDLVNNLPPQLAGFLKKQRYTKETSFDAIMPTLNDVVRSSPRLTIIIFCDGDGQVSGIPTAEGINATFKQHQHQMEKGRVPFVIVLRSQFDRNQVGHYVGCTINSAESISMPKFPPFPPPPPPPAPVRVAPPPPPPTAPPLIVIGTKTETNPPPPAPQPAPPAAAPQNTPAPKLPPTALPLSPPAPPAASPTPMTPMAQTNSASPPSAQVQESNQPAISSVQTTPPSVPPPQASVPPAPPGAITVSPVESSDISKVRLLGAAGALLLGIVAIAFILVRRSRSQATSSLITESLKKR